MMIDYDKYSLIVDNQRTLINSAAFHYFRCPGEKTWKDRLSKIKACGYNTVDLYFCWSYHSKNRGVYDFTGIRDIRRLLEITAELGLFVIARPGPFINAELSLGGLPEWLLNTPDIIIRNKQDGNFIYSKPYMNALKEWYSRIIPIINEYHNVIAFQIENEYFTNEAEPDYLQELYDLSRSLGIKVPIFHNDALSVGLYSDIVNIYAFDTYPTITLKYDWKDFPDTFGVLDNAENNLAECRIKAPLHIAELQAGWFDKWGGIGYENVRTQFKKEHINIVTKTALSQGITMFNHYMGCGGTSWDRLACSEVYTSYDFAAPISETGIPRENYYKAKEINYFLKAFNLSSTDLISEGAEITGENKENIFVRLRKDNLNNSSWLFVRNLNKQEQNLKILNEYDLKIKPFDMKILPVDLYLNACKINFSSMEIFGRLQKEKNHEIIFFFLDENSETIISEFNKETEEKEILIIKSEDLEDFSSYKFTKQNKTTEFIFVKQETADKTWIFNDKVVVGADFLTENMEKAAFSKTTEIKILKETETQWHTKKIAISEEEYSPQLSDWKIFKCAPEIDLNYDYSDWSCLTEPHKFDCISNQVYDDYIWYKGSCKHLPDNIEISARHCYAIYINGKEIYSHNTFAFDHGHEISETITFEINKKLFKSPELPHSQNEITILVQNLGFDKGFQNELITSRGILSFKSLHKIATTPDMPEIEWKIKGGLIPLTEKWAYDSEENIINTSENSYLIWLNANFKIPEEFLFGSQNNKYSPLMLDLENAKFDKADIYLNGNLIGRFWKTKGPQSVFYMPEEFLKPDNKLSLLIWNRKNDIQTIEDYKSKTCCVNIKIGNFKTYSLVNVEESIL